VFCFLLRRNALLELDGEIPATNVSPEYLARQLDMPVTEARDGVTAAVTSGLIAIEGDVVRFVGWDEGWQGPRSDAERAAAYRQKKALKPAKPPEPVTQRHVTPVTDRDASRGVTDLEEKREEKKRREKRKTTPPAASGSFDFAEGSVVGAEPAKGSDHHAFIAAFDEVFAEANGGAKPSWPPKRHPKVKALLQAHGLEECVRRAGNMYRAPPPWPDGSHDFDTLVTHFDKFAQPFKRAGGHFKVTGDEVYAGGEVEI
jgi:hypothetical protein